MRLTSKLRLATEIVVAYGRVRILLGRHDLPSVVSVLRTAGANRNQSTDSARLGAAVVRTLRLLPADTRCLTQSLVLLKLLTERGVGAELVIAVRPSEGDDLGAHAWIEVDGRPVLAPGTADHGRLVTL